ncbi:MAG: phosphodiester glycosidase family protein [Mycobacteriales bacterium]
MRPTRVFRLISAAALAATLGVALGQPASADPHAGRSWLPTTPDQWPIVVDETTTPHQTLTRGVEQWSDHLETAGGAQRAQVLDVDLADPTVRLGMVESHDHLTDPADEVPTSMAHRTGAVAGVNADFFEIYASGRPEGMVVIDGELVKSPNPQRPWDLWVRTDGTIGTGEEKYAATVTAPGGAGHALNGVNDVNLLGGAGALVRVTSWLGTPSPVPAATVATGHLDGGAFVVDAVTTGVTDLPQLPKTTQDLVGTGESGQWLAANAHPGDRLALAETLTPDPLSRIRQAATGGAILVADGQRAVPLQGDGENNVANPVTAVGVSKDGRHAIFAAFDGHQPEGVAQGLTRPQLAGWMMEHGAYNAVLFDSGGSTQMVGRLPGDTQASVLNVPSDGHERPVTNGLFLYSTTGGAGPAVTATVNGGKPLTALAGTTLDVSAYARDRLANPAREPVTVSVYPPGLAAVHGKTLTVGSRAGRGVLVARAGHARTEVPFTVVDRLGSLAVSPTQADLNNGDTQQLTVAATARTGQPVTLPPAAVTWTVDPAGLGAVDAHGVFTAPGAGTGLATVTAHAGGASASTSVAVGQTAQLVDPLTDLSKWGMSTAYMNVYPRKVPSPGPHETTMGSMSFAPDEKPTPDSAGSFKIHYRYPYESKTFDLDVYLNDPESEQVGLLNGTQAPIGLGVWVKGNPDLASRPGAGLAPGIVTLNVGIWQATNQPTSFYPTGITFDGWQYVVAKLPPGLQYPLRINYLALVTIKPGPNLEGDVYLSGLRALYSPRPPVPFQYHALPDNPSWLRFTDVDSFAQGGTTIAAMDDAHVRATDPGGTGPVTLRAIGDAFAALPDRARPDRVQALGDMPDSGVPENLQYARSLLDGLGVPYRDAPGNHEITQGANPENTNFTQVFGPTHYAYTTGPANVIVTDSAHIGILASDPYQVPDEGRSQYLWLADQLTKNRSKVVVVATHAPAYDPHPRADSQFADRWEAHMYEKLLARYQETHRGTHVVLLFGHSRGFSENLLDANGVDSPGGLPNFVVADAGSPPYAPTDQGGFYHYALFHVLNDGTVQFAVQPVLASVAVTAPHTTLARGTSEQLTATGTTVTGDDAAAPLTVPIADPVSRRWSTSDPRLATVDPSTGRVQAHHPGTVTITCTTGGRTATTTLTIT